MWKMLISKILGETPKTKVQEVKKDKYILSSVFPNKKIMKEAEKYL